MTVQTSLDNVTRRLMPPAQAVLSALSLALIVRSIVFVLLHYTPEAFFDLWFWVSDFKIWTDHHFTLHDLFKAHYGQHRIATTRLLLLLDSVFFGMSGLSIVLANLVLLAGSALLLSRFARADGVALTGWVLPPLFWIALMLSVGQVENLIFPFQVQFSIICLAACSAAALLAWACDLSGWRGWVASSLAGLCSIVSIFSMASGVLTVPGLVVLLLLRRARLAIWLSYGPLAAVGIALFFHHYPASPRVPLFDASLVSTRVLYVGNFLGSALTGFPHLAAAAGLCGLALFLSACWVLLSRFTLAGRPVASGDAALVALGSAICLCGPAASLTFRIMMGAQAALVSRYATMSLLFAGVLFGLYARWGARSAWPNWVCAGVLPLSAVAVLLVVNAPIYDEIAAGWHRAVLSDAQLLRNNVGVEGPAPVIFLGKVDDVRDQVRFLHKEAINMFSAGEGPPALLLAMLQQADLTEMPPCRGYVDKAFPIDRAAFLVQGWMASPDASHTLPWMAALDERGTVLGTSRMLSPRPDVAQALHLRNPALGFDAGFRLAPPGQFAGDPVQIHIVGLDPGADKPLCALPQAMMVGPVQLTPVEELGRLITRSDGPPSLSGFSQLSGQKAPFSGPVWSSHSSDGTDCVLRFSLRQVTGGDQPLIIPFIMMTGAEDGQITFRFADGTVLATSLRWLWDRPAWRAAVLPAEVRQKHGGVREVDVTAAHGTLLLTGAPMDAELRPDWSQLF